MSAITKFCNRSRF